MRFNSCIHAGSQNPAELARYDYGNEREVATKHPDWLKFCRLS